MSISGRVVGDGEERGLLVQMARDLGLEDKVTFVGKVTNEDVGTYIAAADIFVLPSISESFGIVNLEAMACGLPILASRVGGVLHDGAQ